MATRAITPEVVETALSSLFGAAEQSRRTYLRTSTEVRRAEAQVLRQEREVLMQRLGSNHPRIRALERVASGDEAAADFTRDTLERAERSPEVRPGDWVVLGRVLPAKAEPVAGLVVKVFDRERKFAPRMGQATTDSRGEFMIAYHADLVAEVFKANPDLLLTVMDAKGKALFTTKEAFRAQPGRVQQFEIRLPGKTPPGPRDKVRRPRR